MPETTSGWTPRGTAQVNFRAGELQDDLEARTEAGQGLALTAKRDLERYYCQLKLALPTFSEAEASLIVDVQNGTMVEPHTAGFLWANVADALDDGYAEKWQVDGPALVARLRNLTPFEALAVADACERFWRGPYRREGPLGDALRAVGLVKREQAVPPSQALSFRA